MALSAKKRVRCGDGPKRGRSPGSAHYRSGHDRAWTVPTVRCALFSFAEAQRFIVCFGGDVNHHPSRRLFKDHIHGSLSEGGTFSNSYVDLRLFSLRSSALFCASGLALFSWCCRFLFQGHAAHVPQLLFYSFISEATLESYLRHLATTTTYL